MSCQPRIKIKISRKNELWLRILINIHFCYHVGSREFINISGSVCAPECGCDLRAPFPFIFVSFLCRRRCRGISTAFVFVLARSTCFLGRQHFLLKSGVFKISLRRAARRRQRHCHFRCWERFNKSLQNKGQHLKTKLKA